MKNVVMVSLIITIIILAMVTNKAQITGGVWSTISCANIDCVEELLNNAPDHDANEAKILVSPNGLVYNVVMRRPGTTLDRNLRGLPAPNPVIAPK